MEGEIASCHWRACETCEHITDEGCSLGVVDYDFDPYSEQIVCMDYEEKEA